MWLRWASFLLSSSVYVCTIFSDVLNVLFLFRGTENFEIFRVVSLFSYQVSYLLSHATACIYYHNQSKLSTTFLIILNILLGKCLSCANKRDSTTLYFSCQQLFWYYFNNVIIRLILYKNICFIRFVAYTLRAFKIFLFS